MKFNTFDLFELIKAVILFNVQIISTLSEKLFHYGSWVLLMQHQTSLIASLLFIMTRYPSLSFTLSAPTSSQTFLQGNGI